MARPPSEPPAPPGAPPDAPPGAPPDAPPFAPPAPEGSGAPSDAPSDAALPDTASPGAGAAASSESGASEHRFPCSNCGGDLRFDPEAGLLVCDFCGNSEEIASHGGGHAALEEQDLKATLDRLANAAPSEEVSTVQCTNCGAVFEFDPAIHAGTCPFCDSPIVVDPGLSRQIRPRGLAPFALSEKAARAAMNEWLGRLWFAPNGLQQYARKGRRLSGIYLPYWTFDADTHSRYSGARGTYYYVSRTVMRNGKRTTVRERRTRWRSVSGRVARFFDDVLVAASRSLPSRQLRDLAPWDLADLVPYQPEYLAGFRAESYTVALDEGFAEARKQMDRVIERDVRFDIGGDTQRIHRIETRISDTTFKHVLLPVWVAAYRYRGRSYRFIVNGRTGRVSGERPWSAWKIAFAVIALALLAGAIGYVIAQQQ